MSDIFFPALKYSTTGKKLKSKIIKSSVGIKPKQGKFYTWYGHKEQEKWFEVNHGVFLVLVVKPDNWKNPSPDLAVKEFILAKGENLYLPKKSAFGFRSLEIGGELTLHSSFSPVESEKDTYRFESNFWYYDTFMF